MIKNSLKKIKLWLVATVIIVSSITLVAFDDSVNFEIAKNLDIYYTLFRELNLYYVDETKPGDLIKKSIDAMLNSLDPYTVYIPESQMEDFRFMTTGQYGGVGALIREDGDYIVITEPYEGFPAQKNDIRAGDVILAVDGLSIKGKSTSEVSELLKGQPKTKINLKLKRPGITEPIEKTIEREEIKIDAVQYYGVVSDSIGYINLSSFTESSYIEVKNALTKLKENAAVKYLIFDLRRNPGGLLIEAVNITNLFVSKSEIIVSTKGKVKDWDKVYTGMMTPIAPEIPIAVLVNSGSASASEIVSGAIQDLDRGVVIGQRTFGKGLVQTTRPLSYNAKLKVTTAKYYTPSGRCIQALDYTHRNPDGSVGKVPDSLVTPFKTKNGRIVYDGGGVTPDINVEVEQFSNIKASLLTKNLIFDFATLYTIQHQSIPEITKFTITDEIYGQFIDFLKDKDFDYQSESEENLKTLMQTAKEEKYYDLVKNEAEILKTKLAHDKNKDLQVFKEEIKQSVFQEIASRYYFQKGRIKALLISDPVIKEAIAVLQDKTRYKLVLSGQSTNK
ncbi:MAG: peptidase S41 [Bacteroidetes bacterium CG_4_8_14_3_um_filter_31_14]|nr:MAG: peptidase S41 [Bacteroidetes bacterium CG_4_8_14_3_um_filter_31_14]